LETGVGGGVNTVKTQKIEKWAECMTPPLPSSYGGAALASTVFIRIVSFVVTRLDDELKHDAGQINIPKM